MKRILITISGLKFHKDEGAKNRLDSFINSYSKNGFAVDVLLFFSLQSFRYIFNKKSYLNNNANWILFPTLPLSKNIWLAKSSLFFNQCIFAFISRLKKYSIYQSEILGSIGRFRPKQGVYIVDFHGDSVTETRYRYNEQKEQLENLLLLDQCNGVLYSDYIVMVSEELRRQLEFNTSHQISNFGIISCGVQIERFSNPNIINVEWKDRIVLGYLGGLQKWQNVDNILDIVINLRASNTNIFFALYTNDSINAIKEKLDIIGTDNFYIRSLKFSEVPDYLNLLDAGFLIRENLPLNIVSSPTKTVEYLASGVPVICTKYSGDYKRSIRHLNEGFVLGDILLSDSEYLALNDYLIDLKRHRDKYRNICRIAASERNWESEFDSFISMIYNV